MIDIFPPNVQEYIKDSSVKFSISPETKFYEIAQEKLGREGIFDVRGFFVPDENKIYLKENATASTIAHEVGHSIDWYLGDRQVRFLSQCHSGIFLNFKKAKEAKLCVTPYSLKSVTEYFAEGFSSFLGLNENKMICQADRQCLKITAPFLENYFSRLFRM